MRKRYDFMSVFTSHVDLGIEFVERFQLRRIAFAIFLPVIFATVFAVLWAVLTDDISSAFTIAGWSFTFLAHKIGFEWCTFHRIHDVRLFCMLGPHRGDQPGGILVKGYERRMKPQPNRRSFDVVSMQY